MCHDQNRPLDDSPLPSFRANARAPVRTSIKVLKNGQSWHGGSHKWSLPEQDDKGNWKPGAWTANITPILCERGWHLTDNPVAWWGDGEEVIAYLVEYEGATAGPDSDPDTTDDPTKFAVERCRLLRPLTPAELAEKGIFLTGELDELKEGRYVLGGTARVRSLNGTARVDRMYDTARVDRMDGTARVGSMHDTARVGSMHDTARVGSMHGTASVWSMYDTARVGSMHDTASVDRMYDTARVDRMHDTASVDRMYDTASVWSMYDTARVDRMHGTASVWSMHDTARVDRMYDTARVDRMDGTARVGSMDGTARVGSMHGTASVWSMHDTASVWSMYDTARVDRMDGTARVGSMDGTATVHASGDAIVVVRQSSPTVTLRGRASCVDYRTPKPTLHVADDGKVLTLAGDGTVSQTDIE